MEAIFLVYGAGGPQLKRNPLDSAAMHSLRFRHAPRSLLRLFAASLIAGCATNHISWRLVPSEIHSQLPNGPPVEVPDVITHGVPATVFVWTQCGGCTRIGPSQVSSDDRLVTIRVLDSALARLPDDYFCPGIINWTRRTVIITFVTAGSSLIRVVGTDTVEVPVLVR